MDFVGRRDELAALQRRWDSDRGEFFVLYGRRRVGKSELLLRFGRDRTTLYFEATSGTRQDHLDDLSDVLADISGRALYREQALTTWRAAFAALSELVEEGPILIVLDEFQFIARKEPEIGSLLNRFVRRHRDDAGMMLCVAGSDVSFFERDIMGESATTYGRRTGSQRLLPFSWHDAEPFLRGWRIDEQVRAWGVFGGIPYYLEEIDTRRPLAEAILHGVLNPDAKLREEPRFLLSQETRIKDIDTYMSILRAIAGGITRLNEIAQRIQKETEATRPFLATLDDMGLVERRYPVTNVGGNKVFYAISDPFLRFWFRFVAPAESRLSSRAGAEQHLADRVLPELDRFISEDAFERLCQGWTLANVPGVARAGHWWGSIRVREDGRQRSRRFEADVAAVDEQGDVVALGSCKWPGTDNVGHEHDAGELDKLETIRAQLGASDAKLLFFDRVGFSPRLHAIAGARDDVELIELDRLR